MMAAEFCAPIAAFTGRMRCIADHQRRLQAGGFGNDALERFFRSLQERLFFDQIARWIAGQRQFWKDDDLCSGLLPSSRKVQDLRTITVQISNRVINLGDSNTHESSFYRRGSESFCNCRWTRARPIVKSGSWNEAGYARKGKGNEFNVRISGVGDSDAFDACSAYEAQRGHGGVAGSGIRSGVHSRSVSGGASRYS